MGVLADLYSYGDGLKRKVKNVLADPMGSLDLGVRRFGEDQNALLNLMSNAYPMAGDKTVLNSPQQKSQMRSKLADLATDQAMAGSINWPQSPKTFYHGSADPFERFDPSLLGTNTKSADAGIGFHFSDNKADASLYADMAKRARLLRDEPWLSKSDVDGASGVVRSFDLNMQNPLVVGMNDSEGNAGKLTQQFLDDKWAARRYADANGHDGIIYPQGTNVDSGYTAIAFDPDQIVKKATQSKKK